jgi:hypothetical protein
MRILEPAAAKAPRERLALHDPHKSSANVQISIGTAVSGPAEVNRRHLPTTSPRYRLGNRCGRYDDGDRNRGTSYGAEDGGQPTTLAAGNAPAKAASPSWGPPCASFLIVSMCPAWNKLVMRYDRRSQNPPSTVRHASNVAGRALCTVCPRRYPMIDQIPRTARSSLAPAGRISRSLLNVPFQSSIRALMLLQAARRALSCLCGESPTSSSSSARPLGP